MAFMQTGFKEINVASALPLKRTWPQLNGTEANPGLQPCKKACGGGLQRAGFRGIQGEEGGGGFLLNESAQESPEDRAHTRRPSPATCHALAPKRSPQQLSAFSSLKKCL